MALITTGSFAQDLRPGIREWAGATYASIPSKYDQIFDVKAADDRAYEEDVMMSGFGYAVVKPQGSPVSYDSAQQEWSVRYNHVVYGLGFTITQEMMEDGVALKKAQEFTESLAKSMMKTREVVCANVLNNATNGAALMDGGDGVSLGSNAHPTRAGNQSNVPVTPASLSEASLEQAVIDITNYTDSRGLRILAVPRKLIIPNQLQFTAERILKSPLRSSSADNDINALREMGMLPDGVVMSPYLTSSTAYFIKTDVSGLNYFNRKEMEITDDNDFDTTNAKFKGTMRFSQGWTDWRSIYVVGV